MAIQLAKAGATVPWDLLKQCAAQELEARRDAGLKRAVVSNRASAELSSAAGKSDPQPAAKAPGKSVECSEGHEIGKGTAPTPSDSSTSGSSEHMWKE